ncbi:hypothetical protein WHI96_15685 [Pseudonocardia tropica]|uniref:Uncharacterized protein n=1 Tax=Pseudonocardia tropica TaxID=681289 RepID=A0ABV1JZG5_9PSEU
MTVTRTGEATGAADDTAAGAGVREQVARLRDTFRGGRTRDRSRRLRRLGGLERMVTEAEDEFAAAPAADPGRPRVDAGPTPLAADASTGSSRTAKGITREVTASAAVVGHLTVHVLVPQLPFGGVGRSGSGAHHGRFGSETFSHRRAVLRKPSRPDPGIVHPPCDARTDRLLRRIF